MAEVWCYEKEKREETRQTFLTFLEENGYSESDFSTIKIKLVGNSVSIIDERGPMYCRGKWDIFAIESRKPHTPYETSKELCKQFEQKTGIGLAIM